jgi:probable rRNA maturation factor
MPIQVFVADEQSARPVEADRMADLARSVLADRGVGIGGVAELNVLFVDEEAIAALNARFLGHEGATDVLSFPIDEAVLGAPPPPGGPAGGAGPGRGAGVELAAGEGGGGGGDGGEELPLLVGDVVICPEVAWRNAPEHAGTYEDEIALLLVHGILHLLGMDHERDEDAEVMEALEQELLGRYHVEAAP